MRYELTDEEQLAIHQDQIDFALREQERLRMEIERAKEHREGAPKGATKSSLQAQLDSVAAAHAKVVERAKQLEAKTTTA